MPPPAGRDGEKLIDAPALDEELAFFPLDASLAQHLGNDGEFAGIKLATILRTYGDAAHAGDARLSLIHI